MALCLISIKTRNMNLATLVAVWAVLTATATSHAADDLDFDEALLSDENYYDLDSIEENREKRQHNSGFDPSSSAISIQSDPGVVRVKTKTHCTDASPDAPVNAKKRCSKSSGCKYTCDDGYLYPSGDKSLSMTCQGNEWKVVGQDWNIIPPCQKTCDKPCQNGGVCNFETLSCDCKLVHPGPQCQYHLDACNSKNLKFNGKKICSHTGGKYVCKVECSGGGNLINPSVNEYTCDYATGEFSPQHLPKCDNDDGSVIFSFGKGTAQSPRVQPKPCEPNCLNQGLCRNGKCKCQSGFSGSHCQIIEKFCLKKPQTPKGSTMTCTAEICTVKCKEGTKLPEIGAATTTMTCKNGSWVPDHVGWKTVPDCKSTCDPLCQNGGKCNYETTTCECPQSFKGQQCQYNEDRCNVTKLQFNGRADCVPGSNSVKCSLKCPDGHSFSFDPPAEYVCEYETGEFSPQNVPRCNFDHPPSPGACHFWGGAHVKSFDGNLMSFASDCAHVLVNDVKHNTFSLVVQKDQLKCTSRATCALRLTIYLENTVFTFATTDDGKITLTKDSTVSLQVPIETSDLAVRLVGPLVHIKLPVSDVSIKWDKKLMVHVEVTAHLWKKTGGLCGTLDGHVENDFEMRNGHIADSEPTFIASWKSENLGEKCTSDATDERTYSDSPLIANNATEFCTRLLEDENFVSCRNKLNVQKYFESCRWDYYEGKSEEFACEAISNYVHECTRLGAKFESNWRASGFCEMKCSGGSVYKQCGPASQATCTSTSDMHQPAEFCVESCSCPDGTVHHEGSCIRKNQCPCQHNGFLYPVGASRKHKCNECVCKGIRFECTKNKCGARCSVIGASHFTTFDGKMYDHVGTTSYILVKSELFTIQADSAECAGSLSGGQSGSGVSCTRSVTVKLEKLTVQLMQNHQVLINNQEITSFPVVIENVKIRKASSIFLILELPGGVALSWDGFAILYVDVPANFQATTKGLCGTFTHNQKDDFLTRGNIIEHDISTFVNEWKVVDTTPNIPPGIAKSPCENFPEKKAAAERICGRLRTGTFKECARQVDVEPFYQRCMYDVCACGNSPSTCFCPIFAAFGHECTSHDVSVQWRIENKECGVQCPPGQTLQTCGDSCSHSCAEISTNQGCIEQCVEGCNCPTGQTLNENGECVAINKCSCPFEGQNFASGSERIEFKSSRAELCKCQNAKWTCGEASLEDIDRNHPQTFKCDGSKNFEYTHCEPTEPVTCNNRHEKRSSTYALICKPGCKCKDGYVLEPLTKKCVKSENCPCHHGGHSYPEGAVVQEKCVTFTCQGGSWIKKMTDCTGSCSAWGESHFKTFDGRLFEFHGQCSYTLAKSNGVPASKSFKVDIQNVLCGSDGVTCIRSVTLQVGSGVDIETITLSKDKPLPQYGNYKRFVFRQVDLYYIAEVRELDITLYWDRATRIRINLSPDWKNKVEGLCGNYNEDESDDFQSPAGGVTEVSAITLGNSWRNDPTCQTTIKPKNRCVRNAAKKLWAEEKCEILRSDTFRPCHSEVSVEPYYDFCVKDTCACDLGGDCDCLCTAIAAYAQECIENGVGINWRSQELCPFQCDGEDTHYSPCVSPCPLETCDNRFHLETSPKSCEKDFCIEGCQIKKCEEGKIYKSDHSHTCVPIISCIKPICLVVGNVTYREGDLMSENGCTRCFCSQGKKICNEDLCSTPEPETKTIPPSTTVPPNTCPNGYKWNNCLIRCDQLCHSFEFSLHEIGQCGETSDCIGGCEEIGGRKCDSGWRWESDTDCIPVDQCPCKTPDGIQLQPGEYFNENSCRTCRCENNHYRCNDTQCQTPTNPSPSSEELICDYWSRWFDASNASWSDYEKEGLPMKVLKKEFCEEGIISKIECVTKEMETDYTRAGNSNVMCNLESGLFCQNADQEKGGKCHDYKVRYYCSCGTKASTPMEPIAESSTVETTSLPTFTPSTVTPPNKCDPKSFERLIYQDVLVSDQAKGKVNATRNTQKDKITVGNTILYWNGKGDTLHIELNAPTPIYGLIIENGFTGNKNVKTFSVSHSQDGRLFSPVIDENGKEKIFHGPSLSEPARKVIFPEPFEAKYVQVKAKTWENGVFMVVDLLGCSLFGDETIKTSPDENCEEPMGVANGRLQESQISTSSILQGLHTVFGGNSARLEGPSAWRPNSKSSNEWIMFDFKDVRTLSGIATQGDKNSNTWVTEYTVSYSQDKVNWNKILIDDTSIFLGNHDASGIDRKTFTIKIAARYLRIMPVSWENGISMKFEIYGCFEDYPVPPTQPPTPTPPLCPSACPTLPNELKKNCPNCRTGFSWDGFACTKTEDCKCYVNGVPYEQNVPFSTTDCHNCKCTVGGVLHCSPVQCAKCENHWQQSVLTRNCECKCEDCKEGQIICSSSRTCIAKEKQCDQIEDCEDDEKNCTYKPPIIPPLCPEKPQCEGELKQVGLKSEIRVQDGHTVNLQCPAYICIHPPDEHVCLIKGKYVKTFDNTSYITDICDHILAQEEGYWSVKVTKKCSTDSNCNKTITVQQKDREIKLLSYSSIEYNGNRYNLRQAQEIGRHNGFKIDSLGSITTLTMTQHGFTVVLDDDGDVRIIVGNNGKGKINGLCGRFNGVTSDDKTKRNGSLAMSTIDFADSWVEDRAFCSGTTQPTCPLDDAVVICSSIRTKAVSLQKCDAVYKWNQYESICIEKVCECLITKDKDQCKCEVATDYASECQALKPPGIDFNTWKIELKCPFDCPPPLVYHDCYPNECQQTCESLKNTCPLKERLYCCHGCFCPPGYVRKGLECVKPNDCRNCVCSGYARGAIRPFNGSEYYVDGNCTYIASRDKSTDGGHQYEILISKATCKNTLRKFCTDAVTVLYQGHSVQIKRIESYLEQVLTTLDKVPIVRFPFNGEWLTVESFPNDRVIVLLKQLNIEVTFSYGIDDFQIKIPSYSFMGQTEGLCGNCGMDEVTSINSENWTYNVPGDSPCNNEPPGPKQVCDTLPPNKDPCMAIIDKGIFGMCHAVVPPTAYLEDCKKHSCKGNTSCSYIKAYADQCLLKEICINWRSATLCPRSPCGGGLEYRPCESGCSETCNSISSQKKCTLSKGEGCFCPAGKVLKSGKCVLEQECKPCDKQGHFVGDKWKLGNCTTCVCSDIGAGNIKVQCTSIKCTEPTCKVGEQLQTVAGTENDCCPKKICVPRSECPAPQAPVCGPDQVVTKTVTDDNCTTLVCGCVPKDQCPRLVTKTRKPGIILTKDGSGCCPVMIEKCIKESCPAVQCDKYSDLVPFNGSECCPKEVCVPRKDVCVYEPFYISGEIGGERERTAAEKTKEFRFIGEKWSESPCRECVCKESSDGKAQMYCPVKSCPEINLDTGYDEVVVPVIGECCPQIIRKACLANGISYKEGEKWTLPGQPCESFECKKENNVLTKQKTVESCVTSCKLGWQYQQPKAGKCCGECVQVACVDNGTSYEVNDSLKSADKCTTYTCIKSAGLLSIASSNVVCPSTEFCSPGTLKPSEDGCCQVCEIARGNSKECVLIDASEMKNANRFFEIRKRHGNCTIKAGSGKGFKYCEGECGSKINEAKYNLSDSSSKCQCCQGVTRESIAVRFICDDKYEYEKQIFVPTACKCASIDCSTSYIMPNDEGVV